MKNQVDIFYEKQGLRTGLEYCVKKIFVRKLYGKLCGKIRQKGCMEVLGKKKLKHKA